MPKGMLAYRSPIVLRQVETLPEPYRTALLVHPHVRLPREKLLAMPLLDVGIGADGRIRLGDVPLSPGGTPILSAYLRGWLAHRASPYLFPLPADPVKPASEGVARRYMSQIIAGRTPGAGATT